MTSIYLNWNSFKKNVPFTLIILIEAQISY